MTNKTDPKINITISKDKTVAFDLTITSKSAKAEYQKLVKEAGKHVNIKGFRKGMAPQDLVEKELNLSKIYEEIIQNLLPPQYSKIISENKLDPVLRPQIVLKNPPLTLENDWIFTITTCLKPDITLKAYQTELKKLNSKKNEDINKHSQEILDLLVSKTDIIIPQILLDTQTQERLAQLVDSASQAGLTLKQYLAGKNTSLEAYQKQLHDNLTKEWKVNLALDEIALKAKIEVKQEDLKKVLPKESTDPQQANFVFFIIKQQKTLEHLKSLK